MRRAAERRRLRLVVQGDQRFDRHRRRRRLGVVGVGAFARREAIPKMVAVAPDERRDAETDGRSGPSRDDAVRREVCFGETSRRRRARPFARVSARLERAFAHAHARRGGGVAGLDVPREKTGCVVPVRQRQRQRRDLGVARNEARAAPLTLVQRLRDGVCGGGHQRARREVRGGVRDERRRKRAAAEPGKQSRDAPPRAPRGDSQRASFDLDARSFRRVANVARRSARGRVVRRAGRVARR